MKREDRYVKLSNKVSRQVHDITVSVIAFTLHTLQIHMQFTFDRKEL